MKSQLHILLLVNSFFIFAINMFAPLYAIFVQRIDATAYHISGVWSVYLLSIGVLTLVFSKHLNSRRSAFWFLIIAFLLRAVGWSLYLLATQLWHIYAIQLVLALGEAFGGPAFNELYSSFLRKNKFASDWGAVIALNAFIMAIAAFIGGIIVYRYGFEALFLGMISLCFVSVILALLYRKAFLSNGAMKIGDVRFLRF